MRDGEERKWMEWKGWGRVEKMKGEKRKGWRWLEGMGLKVWVVGTEF